jgi:hypothetical protein
MSNDLQLNSNPSGEQDKGLGDNGILLGRVTKVILGQYTKDGKIDKDYAKYGGFGSIGCVRFSLFQTAAESGENTADNLFARPMFSNIKQFPLENEIIAIIKGPSPKLNDNASATDFYYITTFNLWNSQHHNAFPDLRKYEDQMQEKLTNEKTSQTGVDTTMRLGDYFKEQAGFKPLLPFEGDLIIEGRYGQSVRFGTTVPEQANYNTWSSTGSFGDPITIIRNGQGVQDFRGGWIPVVEDINVDGTSIILSHKQNIELDLRDFPLDTFRLGYKAQYNVESVLPIQDLVPSIQNIASTEADRIVLERLKASDNILNQPKF